MVSETAAIGTTWASLLPNWWIFARLSGLRRTHPLGTAQGFLGVFVAIVMAWLVVIYLAIAS